MKILLGITGGIAVYKSAELLRLLKTSGHDVRVVMTKSAEAFVTPLTFQALSGQRVYTDIFDLRSEKAMDHIELARWADIILIAPATADFIARLVHGRADDLLATLCLATQSTIAIAPAMNQQMWLNPATQGNIKTLQQREVLCFGPAEGEQACGEVGPGRMLEPEELLDRINALNNPILNGKKILITAGPTREPIDPVRYLTNHSTGRMGYALAEAAKLAGAHVILISGPTDLQRLTGVETISVNTAEEMHKAVMSRVVNCDIFIAAAAVSDYRVENISPQKIKKSNDNLSLNMLRTPDILAAVTALPTPPFTVGFAAETENVIQNAQNKLLRKKLDMIVANSVADQASFGAGEIEAAILTRSGEVMKLPKMQKYQLSREIIAKLSRECFILEKA